MTYSILLLTLASFTFGEIDDARARVALALSEPPLVAYTLPVVEACRCGTVCDCNKGKGCDCVVEYSESVYQRAVRLNATLMVFVAQPVQQVDGRLSCTAKEWRGDATPRVVRLTPENGKLWENIERPPLENRTWSMMPAFGGGGACSGGR